MNNAPFVYSRTIPFRPPSAEELKRWKDTAADYAIATVAGTHWLPPVEQTLAELARIGVHVERLLGCSDIVQARSVVATTLLDLNKHKAVFWLDADTQLHPVDVLRLLEKSTTPQPRRSTGLPLLPYDLELAPGALVTAVCPSRGRRQLLPVWGDPVTSVTLGAPGPLIPIQAAGMGCAAHPLELLADMADSCKRVRQGWRPFFLPAVVRGYYLAEDFAFYASAAEHGWPAYADPEPRVIHWGDYPYHWEDALNAWGPRNLADVVSVELTRESSP